MQRPLLVLTGGIGLVALIVIAAWAALESSPTASTSSSPSPSSAPSHAGPIRPGLVVWAEVFVSAQLVNGVAGEYVVQAGVLGEDKARVDRVVPWEIGLAGVGFHRPPVGRPVADRLVFVSDDGVTSTVHGIALAAPDAVEDLAQLPDVVWDVAVAPDGSAAFAAIVDREDTEVDRGVVRVALDGSEAVAPILPPARARPAGAMRLAAIARFTVDIDISSDGRFLSRSTCDGPAGCRSEVLALENGRSIDLGKRTVLDIGSDGVALVSNCERPAGCLTEVVDLATGASSPMPAGAREAAFVAVGDRPTIVFIVDRPDGVALHSLDPRSGERHELHRAAPDASLTTLNGPTSLWSPPAGWVPLFEHRPIEGPGAVVHDATRLLLVPTDGGAAIPTDPPAIRPVDPPGVQG